MNRGETFLYIISGETCKRADGYHLGSEALNRRVGAGFTNRNVR